MEWQKEDFTISTEKAKLNISYLHQYLSVESYWAQEIPIEVVEKAVANSVCFGMYHKNQQIGFARMVTDDATFGYLADVFIDENYRGRGLSKWLMEIIMDYPPFQKFRRIMLATKDAQGLYAQFGFINPSDLKEIMYVRRPDIYKKVLSNNFLVDKELTNAHNSWLSTINCQQSSPLPQCNRRSYLCQNFSKCCR